MKIELIMIIILFGCYFTLKAITLITLIKISNNTDKLVKQKFLGELNEVDYEAESEILSTLSGYETVDFRRKNNNSTN